MENLLFSINGTLPIFIIMLIGIIVRRLKIVNDEYVSQANKLNFKIAMPVMLFQNVRWSDITAKFDAKFMTALILMIIAELVIAAGISCVCISPYKRGSFTQGSFRGNTALIGMALLLNMYGASEIGAIAVAIAVPVYNVGAVLALTLFPAEGETKKKSIGDVALNIVKNPLIIGTVAGIAASLLKLRFPQMIETSLSYLSDMAMGTALLCVGASMQFDKFKSRWKEALFATSLKLVIFPLIFIPVIAAMGYRNDALMAAFIILGSPTAVNSYVMARSMNHDEALASGIVVISSIAGAVTMTAWVYFMRILGLV